MSQLQLDLSKIMKNDEYTYSNRTNGVRESLDRDTKSN